MKLAGLGLMLGALAVGVGGAGACTAPGEDAAGAVLGVPVEGLSDTERERFVRGDGEFARHFAASEGLGPTFVASSCETCHPLDGRGHPETFVVRFGQATESGFLPMADQGGPQLQTRATPGAVPERVPEGATGVTRLLAPAVVGLGLIEAVPDAVLLALEDPDDRDSDGVSGRAQRVAPTEGLELLMRADVALPSGTGVSTPFVGRFGRKASAITLLHQTATAYVQDMGITTPFAGVTLLAGSEVLDAGNEITADTLAAVTSYLRTLAPTPESTASADTFTRIGCAACHVTSLTTGASPIAALANVTFAPYSDFLLHDMGPELDDSYTEGIATFSEWRTTPLWGLRYAQRFGGQDPFYLHDGRARSIAEAIAYHGGEAAGARERFDALSDDERNDLIEFLESL